MRRTPKRRTRRSIITMIVVPMALVLAAAGGASCSQSHVETSLSHKARVVEPSAGCDRPIPRSALGAGGHGTRMVHASGATGSYELSVPRTYRWQHPTPLILLFYGFGSDPAQFSSLTGLPERGSAAGYLVVVPHTQGAESEWQFTAHGIDATFIDALVVSLEHTYCVDRSSVFAAGFSAGAAFAIVYSCARPATVAAIATVAVDFQIGCTRPMSILAFHGTDDPLVPYQNGAIGLSLPGVKVSGTLLNMGDWARLDRCDATPRRSRPGSQVIERQWAGCARGTSVILFTIVGGGHSWPGADPSQAVGLTTQQVSATSQIVSFFNRLRP